MPGRRGPCPTVTGVFGRRREGDGSLKSSFSMATRLAAAVVTVAIVSLLAAMIVGLRTGASLARDIYQDRILALRSSADLDTTSQLGFYQRAAEGLAESLQAAEAIERFSVGIDELDAEGAPPSEETDELYVKVIAYVQLQKPEAAIMGDANAGQKGVLEMIADIKASLNDERFSDTYESAIPVSESESELLADEETAIQKKSITMRYSKLIT